VRWDVSAYPVVERSTNQTLWGFDFVPVRDADLEPEFPLDDLECEGIGDPHTAWSANTAGYLMQQSSLGDVYAQLVTYVGQDTELSCESSAGPHPRSAPVTSPVAVALSVKKKEKETRNASESSSSDSESDKIRVPNLAVGPMVVDAPKIPSDGAESSSDSDTSSGSSESDSESDTGAVGAAKSTAAVAALSKAAEPESSSGSESDSESDSDSDPKVPTALPEVAISSGIEDQESNNDGSGSSDEESILEPLPFLPPPFPFEPTSDHDSSDGSESESGSVAFKGTPTHSAQPSRNTSGRKRSAEGGKASSAANIASKRPKINVQLGYVLCSVCYYSTGLGDIGP
jgi:hypothetical protein